MRSLRRRFDRSLLAQGLMLIVLLTGLAALLNPGEHPVAWVARGAFYTAISVVILAFARRGQVREAGADWNTISDLSFKIRHREVPDDPRERTMMRRLVDHQLERLRATRWVVPVFLVLAGLLTFLAVGTAVTTGDWWLSLLAVPLLAAAVSSPWTRRRGEARLHHMRAALRRTSAAAPEDAEGPGRAPAPERYARR